MSEIRVGVLRGGPSPEFEVSLKTGEAVLRCLREEKFVGTEIFVDKKGTWHIHGAPIAIEKAVRNFNVLFNAMHGTYGEDGIVQRILDSHKIPYTGSGTLGSALAMNKGLAKEFYKKAGLRTPAFAVIARSDADEPGEYILRRDGKREYHAELPKIARELFLTFPQPAVVKPLASGSSVGVSMVYGAEEIVRALEEGLEASEALIIEELIRGKEATCGVVEEFRGEDLYALPPIEIVPPKEFKFFDYEAKYSGKTEEICPGRFSSSEKKLIMEGALKAHHALGLDHYSRSDFIVTPRGGVFILETNTLPGLTEESLLPKSLKAVGSGLPELVEHVITLALRKQ